MYFSPAILTSSVKKAQVYLDRLAELRGLTTVHLDILDGQLTEFASLSLMDLSELNFYHLQVDLHLMVEEPMDYLWELAQILAVSRQSIPVRAVIAQITRMSDIDQYLVELQTLKLQAGLCLDLDTPLTELPSVNWRLVHWLQLMGIREIGKQGQLLSPQIWPKISLAKQLVNATPLPTQLVVDGGLKMEHLAILQEYKVDQLAMGSGWWQQSDLSLAYKELMSYL